ncbi:MAG: DMT family transporter [Cyanobacteria bacterium]|nr:DMT family transporter [Cyanobacteriota bacterium]
MDPTPLNVPLSPDATALERSRDRRSPTNPWTGFLALLLACVLWGSSYVVIQSNLDTLTPSVMLLVRFALATAVVLPWIGPRLGRSLPGWELGLWMLLGYGSQTVALLYTTASRSAFISSLYVVLVPLLIGLGGQRVGRRIWGAALLAFGGMGLLSFDGSPPNVGDLWSLGTAIIWSFYICRLEPYARRYDPMLLTFSQGVVMGGGSLLWAIAGGDLIATDWGQVRWGELLYLGAIVTAGSTWLQSFGQRTVNAATAGITYTLEPVFASLFAGWIFGEWFGPQGMVGAALVAIASALGQLPRSRRPTDDPGETGKPKKSP